MPILKISLRAWRKTPGSQIWASFISAALLLSVALLLSLDLSMRTARGRIERENRVSVFISPEVLPEGESKLVDQVTQVLGAHSESEVTTKFVSSQETLRFLKELHPELYAELRDLGEEGTSLVPRVVHATAQFPVGSLGSVTDQVRKISGVEAVETTESRAAAVRSAVVGLQWLMRLLVVGVAAAWVLGWMALARSHSASLAGVVAPLRMWGADGMISRAPGMLAGLWVGIPSGLIAAVTYFFLARPFLQKLSGSSTLFETTTIPGVSAGVALLLTSVIAGLAAGAFSGSAEA